MKLAAIVLALAGAALAQEAPRRDLVRADPEAGRALIAAYGCRTCHAIPGVAGARGTVGPDLAAFGARDFIAGVLPNRPDELTAWLVAPDAYMPSGAMPDMGVTRPEAQAMAAYLMTLRGEPQPSWPVALWRALLGGPE